MTSFMSNYGLYRVVNEEGGFVNKGLYRAVPKVGCREEEDVNLSFGRGLVSKNGFNCSD